MPPEAADDIRVLSHAQAQAAATHTVPEMEEVREGLWQVPIPMPGDFLSYTLSVLHRDAGGGFTIIDPGSPGDGTLIEWEKTLKRLGANLGQVHTLIATHSHPDHLGSADALRNVTGATLVMHEREHEELHTVHDGQHLQYVALMRDWGLPSEVTTRLTEAMMTHHASTPFTPPKADLLVREHSTIERTPWRVLDTPGHTAGHMCLVHEKEHIFVAGDHVLPTVNPGVGLSGTRSDENAIANFFDSLEKLAPFDSYEVLPGHGYRFTGLHTRRTQQAHHLARRAGEVAHLLAGDPGLTVWEIASHLTWSAGWDTLQESPMLLFSGLAQTALYRDAVVKGLLRIPG